MRRAHQWMSVYLPTDLVDEIDQFSRRTGTSRSGVVEAWVRRGSQQEKQAELERQIRECLVGQDSEEVEDTSLARAVVRAARRLALIEGAEGGALENHEAERSTDETIFLA